MLNERIGDYEIIAALGKGGFGSVWKAWSADGTTVALKLLNAQARDNPKVVKKFFHEAMILAKLDHPNITRLMEFFPDGDNYAIVMEYVEGIELRKLLKQQNDLLPFKHAFKIALQSLDAFQYAYENGVLHRDIKPANIMIDRNGNAKIMDFGIAKMGTTASHDTATSMLSIHYTAPERFDKSREIDQRSDLYALGLVFYELFAGKRAFPATETSQIMFAHLNEIPDPPKDFSPDLPDHISQAILKALEKDPADRFNDFAEFKQAIQSTSIDVDEATVVDFDATIIDATLQVDELDTKPPQIKSKDRREAIPPAADKKKSTAVFITAIAAVFIIAGGIGGYLFFKAKAPAPTPATVVPQSAPAPAPAPKPARETVSAPVPEKTPAAAAAPEPTPTPAPLTVQPQPESKAAVAPATVQPQPQPAPKAAVAPAIVQPQPGPKEKTASTTVQPKPEPKVTTVPATSESQPAPKPATALTPVPVAPKVVDEPADKIVEVKNTKDNSVMVSIPAGEFTMGSNTYSAEKPVQKIFLDTFYLDKFLITNAQFNQFVEDTQYRTDAEKEGAGLVRIGRRWKKVEGANWRKPDGLSGIDDKQDHPVSQVSYNDALSYCRWAGKDLPTEAQWEKSARGPDGNTYPWGNSEPDTSQANFDNMVGTTTPVGEYEKGESIYGILDMAGNVYQWCKDWYATGERAAKNPSGPESGKEHVIKGGSFIEGMESLRSANRDRYQPNYSSFLFGFRCATSKKPK